MRIHTIDLHFQNKPQCIASYVFETTQGWVLVDPGPYSTIDRLSDGLTKIGISVKDIKHVLLTHIHFDHAGASWYFAENGSQIYVHPVGLPHMQSPQKLYQSAKRIYGDRMDILWGAMNSIDESKLTPIADRQNVKIGEHTLEAFHTRGHADHHIVWKMDDFGFVGDMLGVRISGSATVPPCPPPEFHLEEWRSSLQLIRKLEFQKVCLTHFGIYDYDLQETKKLEQALQDFVQWIQEKYEQGESMENVLTPFSEFTMDYIKEELPNEAIAAQYKASNPSDMSVMGIYRYIKKYVLNGEN